MGKWQPVNPADLKPGDKVKCVEKLGDEVVVLAGTVRSEVSSEVDLGARCRVKLERTKIINVFDPDFEHTVQWFRRKPAKPTRPAEPPAGTVVRNVSTGEVGVRDTDRDKPWNIHNAGGFYVGPDGWDDWIKPGDEIEIAEWVKP